MSSDGGQVDSNKFLCSLQFVKRISLRCTWKFQAETPREALCATSLQHTLQCVKFTLQPRLTHLAKEIKKKSIKNSSQLDVHHPNITLIAKIAPYSLLSSMDALPRTSQHRIRRFVRGTISRSDGRPRDSKASYYKHSIPSWHRGPAALLPRFGAGYATESTSWQTITTAENFLPINSTVCSLHANSFGSKG